MLLNVGCSSVKSAYNGEEHSHFANPSKVAALKNPNELPPVAEGPVDQDIHTANSGGTGTGSMTGMSTPDTWGGALSVR